MRKNETNERKVENNCKVTYLSMLIILNDTSDEDNKKRTKKKVRTSRWLRNNDFFFPYNDEDKFL